MKRLKKETMFPKNKQWAVDQDYMNDLSQEDREWLMQFNEEYYKGKVKKGDKKAIHQTDEQRKDCYNRNNQANRDLYAIKQCAGNVVQDFDVTDSDGNKTTFLDTVADYDLNIARLENQE